MADQSRFGEGGLLKASALVAAEVTFHILEACIGDIGPGAGERGCRGQYVRTGRGAYDADVLTARVNVTAQYEISEDLPRPRSKERRRASPAGVAPRR
jgi:hypothetical protein